jgi:hypothetical protein
VTHLDWLLNPVTFYSGASICLLVSLSLFVSIKLEIARARSAAGVSQVVKEGDDLAVRGLKAEIERLRESLTRLEARPAQPSVPVQSAGTGINLTKRAQVVRMHRRGEPVQSIAAALETPANEVALLLKVHALTNQEEKKAG